MKPVSATDAAAAAWRGAGLDESALARLELAGTEPVLPSSFAVGTIAQATLGVAALAATETGRRRNGLEQRVAVDMREAALECCGAFTVDGKAPEVWDKLAGLYPCAERGWVRLHTNFAHHRDGLLDVLGLPPGDATTRDAVAAALADRRAEAFEDAAAARGLPASALRSFAAWDRHPQSAAVAALALVEIEPIDAAPPRAWPTLAQDQRPLSGLRIVDLTRILAGPVAGRTLAAYGADVLLVNSPRLPNIAAIADTSRGKRSALADLHDSRDRERFADVIRRADVVLQSYRPGGLDALGFGAVDAARLSPGIVYASLSAYGREGPWAGRRGFDSLVQTATGFNDAEANAAGSATPKAMPMQILDMASGFLLAFGAQAALLRQRARGGSWHVQVSLARTALWLRGLGRVENGFAAPKADFSGLFEASESGFGSLRALRHAARFSATPPGYSRPSMPPGTDALCWP